MPEYLQVIVPSDTVSAKEPLNVLSGVSGFTERTEMTVHLWGRAADKWKALDSVTFTAEKGEHRHLYFSISPEKLTPAFWDVDAEELELIAYHEYPGEITGKLIFIY